MPPQVVQSLGFTLVPENKNEWLDEVEVEKLLCRPFFKRISIHGILVIRLCLC
jgi:hypothetical protein